MPEKSTVRVPSYRKHKATGQAVVTISGKDIYLGQYGSKESRAEYNRIVGEWLANDCQLATAGPEITIVELIARWWKHAKQHYRRNGKATGTEANFKPALTLLKERYGHTEAGKFGPLALKSLRQKWIETGGSRRYVNDNVARVRQIFKWGVSEELVPPAVHQALACVSGLQQGRTEARESAPIMPVADAIVEQTLAHLPAVVADMIRLQRLTGARPGEVCILRPCDVDTTSDVWSYRPESHKTQHHGRERVIFVGPKAQDVLRPYLLRDKEVYCFSPADSERKRRAEQHEQRVTLLSCGSKPGSNRKRSPKRSAGDCYTNDSYRRAIHRACLNNDIPKWAPNQLRHTAGTEVRRLYGLEGAQVVLGHSQANITQVYAERDHQKAADIMREVG